MQITEAHETAQSDGELSCGWWLLPSALCGAAIWVMIIAALVG
jgi:hypothetical protein